MRRLLFILGIFAQFLFAAEEKDAHIPASVYAERCRYVLGKMDSTTAMIMRTADSKPCSLDVNYSYRQESNFYYLTGCDQPGGILLLHPKGLLFLGKKYHIILFQAFREQNLFSKTEHPDEKYFVGDTLLSMDRFDKEFPKAMAGIITLYFSLPQPSFINEPVSGKRYFLDRDVGKELTAKFPGLQLKPVNELLASLRQIKSSREIQLIQKAADITAIGLREAMKSAKPGMYEYELQAVLEYGYLRFGADGPGFPCIIGSGPNSLILHYDDNNRQMQGGEVVVMDVGAEFGGYSADITRTIPVSGKFTDAQRELYEIVLSAQKEALLLMKPGTSTRTIEDKVRQVTAHGLERLGLMKDQEEIKRFLPHGVSHSIGLDVHDVGRNNVLQINMVVTLEPGLYVPADDPNIPQKYWNTGIRIEDDVWIVEGGNRVITEKVPKEIKDIEKLMKQKGLANLRMQL